MSKRGASHKPPCIPLATTVCRPGRLPPLRPTGPDPREGDAEQGKTMLTLANILTLSRILAVPLLVALLWPVGGWFDYALSFALYCLMGITDYFDGYVARSTGTVSRLGMFLDPIADKIMIAAVIVMLVFIETIDGYHVIAGLIILLREIIVSGLREFLAGLQVSIPVTRLAKWKTTFQLVALGALILGGATPQWQWVHETGIVSLWAAAMLTLVTGWDYLRVGLKHMD